MATGYTQDVLTGKITSLPQFARACARNFGALINMRDDSLDAPFPSKGFKPSSYNAKQLPGAIRRITNLVKLSEKELAAAFAKYKKRSLKYYHDGIAKTKQAREQCEQLLAQVREWTPPTNEHKAMKEFMTQQLTSTVEYDGDASYYEGEIAKLNQMTVWEWHDKQLQDAARDINYHRKTQSEEVERTAKRNQWIFALEASLTPKPAKKKKAGKR